MTKWCQSCAAVATFSDDHQSSESPTIGHRDRAPQDSIRCVTRILLEAGRETVVLLTCPVGGTRIIELRNPLYEKKRIAVGNGIGEVRLTVPFNIKVANLARPAPVKVLEVELRETDGRAPGFER